MVQHLVYSIIAAPLLLLGTPTWMARALLSPPWLLRVGALAVALLPGARSCSTSSSIVTHIPVVVDAALHNGLIHFALHALVFVLGADRVDAAR